jgi:hypothetical protein
MKKIIAIAAIIASAQASAFWNNDNGYTNADSRFDGNGYQNMNSNFDGRGYGYNQSYQYGYAPVAPAAK